MNVNLGPQLFGSNMDMHLTLDISKSGHAVHLQETDSPGTFTLSIKSQQTCLV